MSESIIKVDRLGKRYRIRHQQQGGPRYKALRDVFADKTKSVAKRLWCAVRSPLRLDRGEDQGEVSKRSVEDFWALKDVAFEVKQGEVVGIIGRNGAGKSTLLKILSRITEPTTGRVEIDGRVASLLEVGTGFHPELTGRENIFLNGAILGMTKAEIKRKFDEIVAFAEVEKFLDTPVKRYSSGMYVRLAFAVAAHLEPEILVVDEVLAVGDAGFQKKCIGKMGTVASEGRTVLFVSHNLAVVEALCHRALWLHDGELKTDGSATDVITRYHALSERRHDQKRVFEQSLRNGSSPVFTSATLIDESGNETSQILLGGQFRLEIGIHTRNLLGFPSVGVGIDDSMGRRLLTLHNPVQGTALDGVEGQGIIRCQVQSLPLAPGEYSVKLAISENNEEIDVIEKALTFEVLNSDGIRDGRGHLRGLCVARSEWSYTPTPDPAVQA